MPLHVLWLQWRRLGPVCCGTVGFRLHGSDRTMTLVGRCADTTHPVSHSRCACMHPAAIRTRLTPERSCRARIDPSDKARARSLAALQAVISHPSTAPQQPRARRAKHRPSAGSQPIRIMADEVPDPSPFASWPMMESVAERVGESPGKKMLRFFNNLRTSQTARM